MSKYSELVGLLEDSGVLQLEDDWAVEIQSLIKSRSRFAASPVPPAGDVEVLPERRNDHIHLDASMNARAVGFNECLDKCVPIFNRLTAERDTAIKAATLGAENLNKALQTADSLRAENERLKKITRFEDAVACVFDNLKFVAANTGSKEWDDRLEDLAEEVIEYAPEYKKQWKDICALQSELTKARELAKKAYHAGCREESRVYLDQILGHQSAPTDKGDKCSDGGTCGLGGFCTNCHNLP